MITSEIVGGLGLLLLIVLVGYGTPIAVVTGIVGSAGIMILSGMKPALKLAGWLPYSALASFNWVTLPMFIIMGEFALYSGISEKAFSASYKWLGSIKGGLAMAVTSATAVFSACSGSSIACSAMMTRIALPVLRKHRFDDGFSTGLIAVSGTLDALIPPSIIMVIYSMLTQTSLVRILLAGFIPGILTVFNYMLMIYILVRVKPWIAPERQAFSWKERWGSLPGLSGITFIIIVILGGIYSGKFTASEAAAVGTILTLVLGLINRGITWPKFREALTMATVTTSSIFFIVIGAFIFGKFISLSGLARYVAELILKMDVSPIVILLCITVLYIFLGMFLEVVTMMAITLPIVLPVMTSLGYDPIWFGIYMVKMCGIGAVTPPVGLCVYTVSGIVGPSVPLANIFRNVIPFVCIDLVTITILTIFPEIVLWLPSKVL